MKILTAALLALAVGVPPSASLAGNNIHQGKPCQSTTTSGTLIAGAKTSCSFARVVERRANAYPGIGPRVMRVRSPVTRRIYIMRRREADARGYLYVGRTMDLWVREVY